MPESAARQLAALADSVRALSGTRTLEIRNPTEYASYLQDREGIDVLDHAHAEETVRAELQAVVGGSEVPDPAAVARALDKAGADEVAHLRSLTDATTDDGRRRHPGFWADETGELAGAYAHTVR